MITCRSCYRLRCHNHISRFHILSRKYETFMLSTGYQSNVASPVLVRLYFNYFLQLLLVFQIFPSYPIHHMEDFWASTSAFVIPDSACKKSQCTISSNNPDGKVWRNYVKVEICISKSNQKWLIKNINIHLIYFYFQINTYKNINIHCEWYRKCKISEACLICSKPLITMRVNVLLAIYQMHTCIKTVHASQKNVCK